MHDTSEIRIVGLGGSLAERSTSRAALDTVLQGAEAVLDHLDCLLEGGTGHAPA